ncbi:unnamed protein product [Rotaria socialis]|uniref:Uncharacterized protein n=1 Tax=Rotaria socialis TaxID=392032 RepID=A0A818NRR1_9BILA|nr:unnamed protein product [Rotaria socialis]CAF3443673.1 unnamed protein product [Rotaria socialis]CAF3453665.1 unnamed protein product [Rotaria socialis]CAF3610170.1 unnamed protein product [Rotaria socialis]CAF3760030.1 unnamed protein product [Rotaria socialis]
MSLLMVGGRSASARRFSQVAMHGRNYQMIWSSINLQRCDSVSSMDLRRESGSIMHRRRALDLYGTKDVLFTHEQMKRAASRCGGGDSSANFHGYRWVSHVNRHNLRLFLTRQIMP